MERVFLITHVQPEDRKTSKISIPLKTKWKITLQFCVQVNKEEKPNSGEGRRRRESLGENEQRGKERKTLTLSSNVRVQNETKLPRCAE